MAKSYFGYLRFLAKSCLDGKDGMKRLLKFLAWLTLALILLVVSAINYIQRDQLRRAYLPTRIESEFDSRIQQAINPRRLDLSTFNDVDWDELFFIFPYRDTNHLQFDYQGPQISSLDDGEMYIVFLKGGKHVADVRISRGPIDFSLCGDQVCQEPEKWSDKPFGEKCRCRGKIKKAEAVFELSEAQNGSFMANLKPLATESSH